MLQQCRINIKSCVVFHTIMLSCFGYDKRVKLFERRGIMSSIANGRDVGEFCGHDKKCHALCVVTLESGVVLSRNYIRIIFRDS